MKRLFIGSLVFLEVALSGCSSITMVRTKEMKAVGNDVKSEVTKSSAALQLEVDSLRSVIDSLYAEQDLVNKRLRADLSLLATRVADESQRNDSRQEEVLYRLDLLLGKSDKILAKKVVVSGAQNQAPSDSVELDAAMQQEMDKIFNTARSDYLRGEFKLAYSGFKQVYEQVKTGSLAEDALYWMAVCLTEVQQVEKAKVVFNRSIEQFPEGSKTCQCLFKLSTFAAAEKNIPLQKQLLQRILGTKSCTDTSEFLKAAETLETLLNASDTTPKPISNPVLEN
jgi:TolA-binding protein